MEGPVHHVVEGPPDAGSPAPVRMEVVMDLWTRFRGPDVVDTPAEPTLDWGEEVDVTDLLMVEDDPEDQDDEAEEDDRSQRRSAA